MILHGPITPDLVTALKPHVDVYYWNRKTVARKWPVYHPRPPTPAQLAYRTALKQATTWAWTERTAD